ncbi:hypothetical protein [Acinetobacter bohemicus]|uniref:hypothetical protein n=1 Tax=Acinetobacter bohemicus TaxID=1435036 RepID=UPI00192CADF9|nr:hypothetical protein [Acinetobacter bohemicus]CAD9197117.1 Putative NADH dehydrogenase subunit 6 [Acinetobacter bohemicus]
MKHLGFVGKSTEYLGYTHVEIINSLTRLAFNVKSTRNIEEAFKKIVENNYDLLMSTSEEISFELDSETIAMAEQIIKEQGIEFEEFIQNALINFINQSELDAIS